MNGLASSLNAIFLGFSILIVIRVVLSWIPFTPRGTAAREAVGAVHRSTEWFLGFFRRLVPTIGSLDLSPAVALVALGLARVLVTGALTGG